ncbi:MAG: HEAT repeat domain-containing protein [Candidatus Helarchaeota archaeon]|nr:HEAT repeat domain-containing protein [Candidatus Helarchaeota archaeon]
MSEQRIRELIEELDSEDFVTRFTAKNNLLAMGELVVPVLITAFEEEQREMVRYWIVDVLGALKDQARNAVPTLLKALEGDTSEGVRAVAAGVLEVIVEKVEEIVPALIKSLRNDTSSRVQKTVDMTLKKIASKLGYATSEDLIKAFEDK